MLTRNKTLYPLVLSCLILFTFSCKQENPDEILAHISGYWEIEKVRTPEGESRTFTLNMVVDYIEIDNHQGFRKKVAPQPDGTYLVNEDAEAILVEIQDNKVQLLYSTPFDQWTETVIKANKNQLIVKNTEGTIYSYKRFENIPLIE